MEESVLRVILLTQTIIGNSVDQNSHAHWGWCWLLLVTFTSWRAASSLQHL